jgi:ABC-type Fe3+-hydroxamate transport system substrate-binding protein
MRLLLLALISILLVGCSSTAPAQQGVAHTSGSLTVRLLQPQDGATVSTRIVTIKGEAPPETVVSVNDDILVVGADAKFESDVALEEGPNVIEIVASDLDGNEVTSIVAVTYEP